MASATALVAVSPSQALLGLGRGGSSTPGPDPVSQLLGNVTGTSGLGGLLQSVLCVPVSAVDGIVRATGGNPVTDGLAAITGGLTTLTCNTGILDYRIQTTYKRPDGTTVTRTVVAELGVPRPINVDDDAAPDAVATISLTGGNDVGLKVGRIHGETALLPVAVEAIVGNPNGTLLEGRSLSVGFDSTDDNMPNELSITTPMDTILRPSPKFTAKVTQSGPGETVGITAGTFKGVIDDRRDDTRLRLDYGASPERSDLTVDTGTPLKVQATTTHPGKPLKATVTHDRLKAVVGVDVLPAELDVTADRDAGVVTYDGNGTSVGRLTADVRARDGFISGLQRLHADLSGLPVAGSVRFSGGSDEGITLKADPEIGLVDVRASGIDDEYPTVPGPDGDNGVFADTTGEAMRIAARIKRLQSVEFSADPVSLAVRTGEAGPFRVDARIPGEGSEPARVEAAVLDLPESFRIGLGADEADPKLTYEGSAAVDRFDLDATNLPLIDGADRLRVRLKGLPQQGAIGLGGENADGGLSVVADGGIGELLVQATGGGEELPEVPGAEDGHGAFLDTTGDRFRLALRVFDLEAITVNPSPLVLEAKTGSVRPFQVKARIAGSTLGGGGDDAGETPGGGTPDGGDDGENPGGDTPGGDPGEEPPAGDAEPVTTIDATVRDLPREFRLSLGDLAAGGSELTYSGSDPVEEITLKAGGIELLEGADRIEAAIRRVPRAFTLALPDRSVDGSAPLASLTVPDGDEAIGELRLAAGDVELPVTGLQEDGTPNTSLEDELRYGNDGGFKVGARITGLRGLSLSVDPIDLLFRQDETSKPINIDAEVPQEGAAPATISGRVSKPSTMTRIRALVEDGPTRLVFENAANLARLDLEATGLGGLGDVDLSLENLPRKLNVCVDSGPGCRRPNPNPISGGTGGGDGRPYAALVSLDFDDEGTQQSGMTTFNASLPVDGAPVAVENMRFRNLSMDLGQGPAFSGGATAFQSVPRLYAFLDSRNQPFVINDVRFPGTIEHFRLGTDGNPAQANVRLAWLKGVTGFGGFSFDRVERGTSNCGGRRELSVKLGPFSANVLDLFGTQIIRICG
ncbi:MAG: hypothetical protein M0P31_09845 [Solirubrobacteraceae bacterium]|nr:hypothetical protein [Solirubrobacteraceae bacterium]